MAPACSLLRLDSSQLDGSVGLFIPRRIIGGILSSPRRADLRRVTARQPRSLRAVRFHSSIRDGFAACAAFCLRVVLFLVTPAARLAALARAFKRVSLPNHQATFPRKPPSCRRHDRGVTAVNVWGTAQTLRLAKNWTTLSQSWIIFVLSCRAALAWPSRPRNPTRWSTHPLFFFSLLSSFRTAHDRLSYGPY